MPEPMVSHDQKCHVAPHSDCLDLRNAVVSLLMPMASHDQESHVVPHFDLSNTIVPLMTWSALNDASTNGVT